MTNNIYAHHSQILRNSCDIGAPSLSHRFVSENEAHPKVAFPIRQLLLTSNASKRCILLFIIIYYYLLLHIISYYYLFFIPHLPGEGC